MKCLFIYGPPASGKLTIARELVSLTGYSLMHNHQTRNIVHEMYPDALKENYELVHTLRLDIFTYAAQHDTNIVFTFVADSPTDIVFVNNVIETIRNNDSEVLFVEITATDETLLARVGNESRKAHHKLTDQKLLKDDLEAGLFLTFEFENIFKIDTTDIKPADAAQMIVNHYDL
ncbi:MAG: hypothetical protein JWN26_811 [Candidatus Saccharibacteria bacterium]|nr:hypothetical protein [Candidatus Saccharibacteria bacterium]